jgi:hypothetical protein
MNGESGYVGEMAILGQFQGAACTGKPLAKVELSRSRAERVLTDVELGVFS